jgi:hypothetical protein
LALVAPGAGAEGLWPGGPAATTPLNPGGLYLGVGGQVRVQHLPQFNSPLRTGRFLNPGNVLDPWRPSYDPDPLTGGAGLVAGYVFRDGVFPAWAGRRVRLSLGAHFWGGTFKEREQRAAGLRLGTPTIALQAAPIDGSPGSETNLISPLITGRESSLKVDHGGFDLSLGLESNIRVGGRAVLSPMVGIFGGRSRTSFALRAGPSMNEFAFARYALDERLASNRVGLQAGLGAAFRVMAAVTVHVGARGGFVWTRSHMTGADCFAGFTFASLPATCASIPPGPGAFRTSVADTDSAFGFTGNLTGGLTIDLGALVLSLSGFVTYDTAVAGIRNPFVTTPLTGTNSNNARPTTGPARIFYSHAWSYGGMVVLRYQFGW